MANRRMISKDDVESLVFGELTVLQRYLFFTVMLYADDDGIMPVKLVRTRCFPFDSDVKEKDVCSDLQKLQELSFLILYEDDQYLQVMDWWRRQFIDKKLYKQTTHPLPPSYNLRPEDLKKYDRSRRVLEQNRVEKNREDENRPYQNREDELGKKPYLHDDGECKDYPEYPLSS
ncbi:MAG: hypothetical protein ABID64_00145 [Nitrospirota bacterium]